jgi:PEP-CTERM motif
VQPIKYEDVPTFNGNLKTNPTMNISRSLAALFCAALLMAGGQKLHAQAPLPATVTVDESGSGTLMTFVGSFPLTGTPAADPGPGGQPAALTYSLLGPPSLVAGDVMLFDVSLSLSDVIRFNPAGTGSSTYPASLVFYSLAGGTDLADTGFPSASYSNTLSLSESTSGPTMYTPTSTEPGFIAGFSVTYVIDSPSVVPEPSTMSMLLLGIIAICGFRFLHRAV